MELRDECPEGARHVNEDLGKGRSAGQEQSGQRLGGRTEWNRRLEGASYRR